jgi:hypothetical protein
MRFLFVTLFSGLLLAQPLPAPPQDQKPQDVPSVTCTRSSQGRR